MDSDRDLGFGPRLSDAEYQRRIAELYALPNDGSDEADQALRRKELDLRVDHRLGCYFPKERRAALWQVQQRVEKKRLSLAFRHFMRQMLNKLLVHDTQRLARFAADEFAQVLSRSELERFLGVSDASNPQLPIDRETKG